MVFANTGSDWPIHYLLKDDVKVAEFSSCACGEEPLARRVAKLLDQEENNEVSKGMTSKERKRGLRAYIDKKIEYFMKGQEAKFEAFRYDQASRSIMAVRCGMDAMWKIIDKLVDEVEGSHLTGSGKEAK